MAQAPPFGSKGSTTNGGGNGSESDSGGVTVAQALSVLSSKAKTPKARAALATLRAELSGPASDGRAERASKKMSSGSQRPSQKASGSPSGMPTKGNLRAQFGGQR